MASIHPHRTSKGERRYDVRYRDAAGRNRSERFSARKDAQAFKLEVERKRQAGTLYNPERPVCRGELSDGSYPVAALLSRIVPGGGGPTPMPGTPVLWAHSLEAFWKVGLCGLRSPPILIVSPLDVGSGKSGTPLARMHCEYFTSWAWSGVFG